MKRPFLLNYRKLQLSYYTPELHRLRRDPDEETHVARLNVWQCTFNGETSKFKLRKKTTIKEQSDKGN